MTSTRVTRGLRIRRADVTVLDDVSCGSCAPCLAGRDFWCADPREDGTVLASLRADVAIPLLARWVEVLCALVDADLPDTDTVLVLSQQPAAPVIELVRLFHDGPVLASPDGRDDVTREHLTASSPTGRAQAIVTLSDARTAVRSVQRGGTVCLPGFAVDAPSVTELVQRDVRLLGPSTLTRIVQHVPWPTAAEHLAGVLPVEPVGITL